MERERYSLEEKNDFHWRIQYDTEQMDHFNLQSILDVQKQGLPINVILLKLEVEFIMIIHSLKQLEWCVLKLKIYNNYIERCGMLQ